jgi:hypothetical protein
MSDNFFQYLLNLFEDCLKDTEITEFKPIKIKHRSFIYCENNRIPFHKINNKSVTWSKLYDTYNTYSKNEYERG